MKKFITRSILFVLPIVIYFVVNTTINITNKSNQKIELKHSKVIFIGDSQPRQSFDPQFWENSTNICQNGEPSVLTFWKLKKVLQNYHPDTVIFGIGPHTISSYNDLKFSDSRWAGEMFRRSYLIEEFDHIDKELVVDYNELYKTIWKQTSFYPKRNLVNYIGEYYKSDKNDLSEWRRAIERHFYLGNELLGVSPTAMNYIDSTINICNANNIAILLVSSPKHKSYVDNIPNLIRSTFDSLMIVYNKDLLVFDKTYNTSYDDSLFYNVDHLNQYGARVFMNDFKKYIKDIVPE